MAKDPIYRFRNLWWLFWYGFVKATIAARDHCLYVPEYLVKSGDIKNGVQRIPMEDTPHAD